jgi:CRP-like cAMP-binding protein
MNGEATQPQEKFLILAGLLGLAGLATALVYVLNSTPYTMVLFMAGGLLLIAVAALVFAVVIVRDIRSRLASLTSQEFPSGEIICRQGDRLEFMFVISEGEVEFTVEEEGKEEIHIGKLGPADYFGDTAILSDTPFQATARALTDVKLLAIHRRDFKSLYSHLPRLRERVHEEQERRMRMVKEALAKSSG